MTQFSGFAPNYYFGQHNKGLSIYMSPGFIDGTPFNGQIVNVPAQATTNLCITKNNQIMLNPGNLLVSPNNFTNSVWVFNLSSLVQANNQSDPFGGSTASLIGFTNNNQTAVFQSVAPAGILLSGMSVTFSIWLKASSGTPTIKIIIDDQITLIQQNIVTLSTSWQNFSVTGIMNSNSTVIKAVFGDPSDISQNYFVYTPQLVFNSIYNFATVVSGIIDTGGNIVNPNILDDGILSITDIRIR